MKKVILASGSPRRKEILKQAGVEFEVMSAEHEEHSGCQEPEEFVKELAVQKAAAVADMIEEKRKKLEERRKKEDLEREDSEQKDLGQKDLERENLKREDSERESLEQELLVIGADTIVASDGKILGKPKDEKEAFLMLSGLQGKWHQVYTGVCVEVLEKEGERRKICFAERTDVKVSDMDAEEIRNYIATKEPMDKAGSYAIQGRFGRYVERIEGDYYNVVGFPLSRFFRELKEIGILL